jgi:hypothetical protein
MATDDGDRTYTRATMRRPHKSGLQQLVDWARAELLAAMRAASTEEERERMRGQYERLFGPLSQSPGAGG